MYTFRPPSGGPIKLSIDPEKTIHQVCVMLEKSIKSTKSIKLLYRGKLLSPSSKLQDYPDAKDHFFIYLFSETPKKQIKTNFPLMYARSPLAKFKTNYNQQKINMYQSHALKFFPNSQQDQQQYVEFMRAHQNELQQLKNLIPPHRDSIDLEKSLWNTHGDVQEAAYLLLSDTENKIPYPMKTPLQAIQDSIIIWKVDYPNIPLYLPEGQTLFPSESDLMREVERHSNLKDKVFRICNNEQNANEMLSYLGYEM